MNRYIRNYSFRDCRLIGHAWIEVPSDWTPREGVPFTLRCERCDMERRDTINGNTADVVGRRYTYPAGYRFDGIEERPNRTDFRLAWVEDRVAAIREDRRIRRIGK